VSNSQRDKGLRGERQVRHVLADAGWETRGLEGGGDMLAFLRGPVFGSELHPLHIEVKWQETWRLEDWLKQARAEAPAGVPPVVVFRRSHMPWYAALPFTDLLGLPE
jgi:hypothetical protein